jgi:hypothetical protein
LHQLKNADSGNDIVARQPEQIQKAIITQDQPLAGVEHAKALHHIVQSCIQLKVCLAKRDGVGFKNVDRSRNVAHFVEGFRIGYLDNKFVVAQSMHDGRDFSETTENPMFGP